MTLQEFQRRRKAIANKMVPGSALLLFAAPVCQRNADSEYPYRQNSDFWYLSGFNEPEAVLVLIKSDSKHSHSVLFNRDRDPLAETWYGRRLGQEAAAEVLGVDKALSFSEIEQQLPLLLNGLNRVYHAQGLYDYADTLLFTALQQLRDGWRKSLRAPETVSDWRPLLHEMRLFKSAKEIKLMRRAAEITALAHRRAMEKCHAGRFEYQLEGEILHEFMCHGARSPAYSTIVGGGVNACILHYVENSDKLRAGDLVLIDAGCEYQGYAGDITRTFPVSGRFSAAQLALYQLVLQVQERAIELLIPGSSIRAATRAVLEIMVQGLVDLGILQGEKEQLLEDKAWQPYFMHGLSHWLGLDVHDVGDYGSVERDRLLQPGMVLTVEPGLYISPDAEVPAEYRGIGIRIEDDLLITPQGNEVLTAGVVKKPQEIEALMAMARRKA
ncbi:MAG: Xaa-Pro aminopeptidase [Enterobacteriaceae bacterium]